MNIQEFVRDVIREEVRIMLYGNRLNTTEPENVISITKSDVEFLPGAKPFVELSRNEIIVKVQEARQALGLSTQKELFCRMYGGNLAKCQRDFQTIRHFPGRKDARVRFAAELEKVLEARSR